MRPNEPWASSPKSDHHLKHWRWVRANGKKMALSNAFSTRKDTVRGHHNLRSLPRVISGLVNLRRADIKNPIHLVCCVASNGQARLPHRPMHPTWGRARADVRTLLNRRVRHRGEKTKQAQPSIVGPRSGPHAAGSCGRPLTAA
jgi:hypothetical protein